MCTHEPCSWWGVPELLRRRQWLKIRALDNLVVALVPAAQASLECRPNLECGGGCDPVSEVTDEET